MLTDVPETPKTIIPESDEPPRGGSVSTVPTRAPDTVGRAVVVILATRETTRGASRGLRRGQTEVRPLGRGKTAEAPVVVNDDHRAE